MAEVSLIASVIGIAGAGAKLTVTLYTFAETVNSADKSIRDVARDVSITSSVLSQLASIMEQDKNAKISKEDAIKTADEAVRGCSDIFGEIDSALEKSISNINAGKTKAAFEKMKWAFNEPKMEVLRSNLERMKSSLLLLLSVLSYAREIATDRLGPHNKTNRRSEIVELNRSKADNQRKHEELLKAIESINITPAELRDSREYRYIPRKPVPMDCSRASPSLQPCPSFPSLSNPTRSHPSITETVPLQTADPTGILVSELSLCAARVAYLLGRIESTPREIRVIGLSAVSRLKHDYQGTKTFLDQRLLTLNHEPLINNAAGGIWHHQQNAVGMSSIDAKYQFQLHSAQIQPRQPRKPEIYKAQTEDEQQQRILQEQMPAQVLATSQQARQMRMQQMQKQQMQKQQMQMQQMQKQQMQMQQMQMQQMQIYQCQMPYQAPQQQRIHSNHSSPQSTSMPPLPSISRKRAPKRRFAREDENNQPRYLDQSLAKPPPQRTPDEPDTEVRNRKRDDTFYPCNLAPDYITHGSQRLSLGYESSSVQDDGDARISLDDRITGYPHGRDNVVDVLLQRWTTVLD